MQETERKITVVSEYKSKDQQQRRTAYIEKMARAISLAEKKASYGSGGEED